ncbi:MAG: hypothetical protein J0L84_04745 [Verrucomicrobia bacterium]|nr:hypothetical protein [Verrucomicrobiota bacterium]
MVNLGGGYIVLGVAERDGRPVLPPAGLKPTQLDVIQKQVLELGQHAIQPAFHPVMVPAEIGGKHLLVLWAPGGQTRPYKARRSIARDAREWAYFIRKGSCTVRARGVDEQELVSLAATVPFDDRINQHVVWFPDGAGGDRFEEKIFQGPLGQMTREALNFIRRSYLRETVIKHRDRAEVTRVENFPYAAVEEAVVNAIYHRSYEEREPVEVRISPDELAVLSFPGPDRSIALADLRRGKAVSRRYRNRRIGEFLKELDLTEGRATGIPKILQAMRTNGSPMPIIQTDEDRISFLIRLPVHPKAKPPEPPIVTGEVTGEVGRLLTALVGERKRTELQAALGLKHEDHFRRAYLLPALQGGWIEMTLPGKPKSRLQRYRVTGKGATWVELRRTASRHTNTRGPSPH